MYMCIWLIKTDRVSSCHRKVFNILTHKKQMDSLKRNRIILSYTGREWLQIQSEIEKLGKKQPIQFLISESKTLQTSFLNFHPFPENLLHVEKKSLYPPDETFEILKNLSDKLKQPPSTLVARLIFNPLLKK